MRSLLLWVMLLIGAAVCFAQGLVVSGKVVDSDGKPLQGVAVRLMTRSQGAKITMTDAKGAFLFPYMDVGLYPVSFEKDGYATVSRRMEVKYDEGEPDSGDNAIVMAKK